MDKYAHTSDAVDSASEASVPTPVKAKRRFTKRILITNLGLVWALMFASVYYQQASSVVPGAFALIGTLFGIYTGIGHMDFRKAIDLTQQSNAFDHDYSSHNEEG